MPVVTQAMARAVAAQPIRPRSMRSCRMREWIALGLFLAAVLPSTAATLFTDGFAASSVNATSPAAPTAVSTAYQFFSSKPASPAPAHATNDLRYGIGATASGHIEAQALFTTTPVTLVAAGDYVEMIVTFTNTAGLFTEKGHLGFGLYNSGGAAPLAGGMNGTATSSTTGVTGGAQGWRGYVSRIAYNGDTHRIATRPAQSSTTGNNQDLVTEGSGSMSYTGAVSLAGSSSTLDLAAGSQLTESFRITLTGSNACQIESRLYQGADALGDLLFSQAATANGAGFYNGIDALAIGWRVTTNTSATTLDLASLTINAQVGSGDNTVAGLHFLQQPTDAPADTGLSPPVTVGATNVSGAAVSNATVILTLATGAGTLNGTTSQRTDASGVAAFTNLSLTAAGAKQMQAASGSATALSALFNVLGDTNAQTLAFPGAEGAGAYAIGGRGGDVYYVTTLADSGAGSLRYGISTAPTTGRSILFKVSGNIVLTSTLTVNKPRLTIAGQTAPGEGVCLQNYSFNIGASDVVVRHLRTRLGTNALQEADSMWINAGTNIIVDHLSASWSVDETLSASAGADRVTVQWCAIAESLNNSIHSKGAHGYGSLITPGANTTYSWHHNLYAHHHSRNPRPGTDSAATFIFDFRNNAIYNYGSRAGYGSDWDPDPEYLHMNYAGNYIVAGPDSTYDYAFQGGGTNTVLYQAANLVDLNLNSRFDGTDNGWGNFSGTYTPTNAAFTAPTLTIDAAPVALERVLACAGAMPWRRDAADQRIIATVRNHNGQIIDYTDQVGGWPTLSSATAPADRDSDGMPDYWELALGLNPTNAADRNLTNNLTGYTRLEDYVNWLADPHALCDRNGQADISLRDLTGSTTNLAYTVARGANGSVSLLANGYTARFIATNGYTGPASFSFTATDPANAITFGAVAVGVLVTVTNAPNSPPTFAAISNQTLIAGALLCLTNVASDTDAPPQTLTFSLNAPTNASINSSNGVMMWRPMVVQSPSTNVLSVVVTDSGTPSLSATQAFTVTVLQPRSPALETPSWMAGQFAFSVAGDPGPDYIIQASTDLANWSNVWTTNSPALPFTWRDGASNCSQRFYRVLLGP